MKFKLLMLVAVSALCGQVLVSGCKVTSGQAPPAKFEEKFFDIQTNLVTEIVPLKLEVWVTNREVVIYEVTNELNQIVVVTNQVDKYEVKVVTSQETNTIEEYIFTPKESAKQDVQTVAEIGNLIVPGAGVFISGIGTALLGLWGRFRSAKRKADLADERSGILTSNIEAIMLAVEESSPQGSELVAASKTWLKANHRKLGAIEDVARIMNRYLDDQKAREGAVEIIIAAKRLRTLSEQP